MKRVHVAVGVIIDSNNKILIAKRPEHLHQGGKWEFPGGKVESNETTTQALIRELKEEVNLDVFDTEPMMTLSFDYPDKHVFLDVHTVLNFKGYAEGIEGQQIRWVTKSEINNYEFPEANSPIVETLLANTIQVS